MSSLSRHIAAASTLLLANAVSVLAADQAWAADEMFGEISTQRLLNSSPAEMWSGPYLGLTLGYGWTDLEATDIFATVTGVGSGSLPLAGFTTSENGINGGLTAGYNLYTSSMVLGLEGDVSFGDYIFSSGPLSATGVFVAGDTLSGSFEGGFDAFGTIRARAGLLISPQTLLYATGGVVLARTKAELAFTYDDGTGPISGSFEDKNIEFGYAVGAGIEDRFTEQLSMKLEYLYLGLPDNQFEFSQPGVTVGFDGTAYMHLVRLGLNYSF